MKRLHLLRHAKSSRDDAALADQERPLAPRGRRAAESIGAHMRETGVTLDVVLCSSARRTVETLELISPALGEAEVLIEGALYGAGADELLARLCLLPAEVGAAMLIGHNPAIESLALSLAGEGDLLDEMARKFPTGALASLTFEGAWRELDARRAALAAFVRPRDLE